MNNLLNNLFSRATLLVVAAGAGGGLLGFLLGETRANDGLASDGILDILVQTAIWTAFIAFALGPTILAGENAVSLRGKWHRDVPKGLIAFPIIGLLSGTVAQIVYALGSFLISNPSPDNPVQVIVRAVGWMLLGLGMGAGVGAVRGDFKAALRGMLGGAAGGFVGGFFFDFLSRFGSQDGASFSRCFGLVVMGAAIAFGLRLAEQTLKSAWLLGISTGPYEGKESPLDKKRISVGRSDAADLSLYRDETVPDMLGEFIFQNNEWFWQGQSVEIDGSQQTNAPIHNGSILQLGTYRFRFMTRSESDPALNSNQAIPISATNTPYAATPPPVVAPPAMAKVAPQPAGPIVLKPVGNQFLPLELHRTSHSLGRALDNDLVVSEATVSSSHAHFYLERGSWNLRDVGSTNGTYVNGNRIDENAIKIRVGDRVRFGSVEFEVGSL